MIRLLLATRNDHKVAEIQTILGANISCLTLKHFPAAPVVEEDAETFSANATKKAQTLAQWLSGQDVSPAVLPEFVLADDSGLEVDALNGAPGVYSARFAAREARTPGNSTDADNNTKLLRLLKEVPREERTARFRCVIALVRMGMKPDFASSVELFDGVCEGAIGFGPSGQGGFGYDPLFTPAGQSKTFAELGEAIKNTLSHRAKALGKLREHLLVCTRRRRTFSRLEGTC